MVQSLSNLSLPRLLRLALSLLCVLALVLGLASGALAASGDSSGPFSGSCSDFPRVTGFQNSNSPLFTPSGVALSLYSTGNHLYILPSSLSYAGTLSFGNDNWITSGSGLRYGSNSAYGWNFYDYSGSLISSLPMSTWLSSLSPSSGSYYQPSLLPSVSVPSGTRFIFLYSYNSFITNDDYLFYSNFYYDDVVVDGGGSGSGGSAYDPTLDQDILDGVTVIAQSLLDLESGPYSGVTDVTPDSFGDLQHTVVSTASLEDLLNALGIAGTDTNHVIRGIYNNFGSYFTLYSINDTTSSTTQVYRGLPQYVNALGQSVTDGINRLQRDHDILYQQTASLASDLSDALYEDTDSSPSESWSVARWLKELVSSVTTFFSSFWSQGETELKSDADPAYQEAHDQGLVPSDSDISDFGSVSSGLSSYSSGSSSVGIVGEIPKSEYYQFWSQEVKDSLLPQSQTRSQSSGDDLWLPSDSDYYRLFGKGDSR